MLSAAVLYQRGVEHGNAGRHAAARRALDEAARRTDDPDLLARIGGTIAYVASETGDADAGIALCRSALGTAGMSSHTRAILTSQLGLIELRRGDGAAALPLLTSAILELGDDPARLGRVHLNRGLVYLERGEVANALADFARAADAFARSDEPVELAKALNNQGYAAMLAGDLIAALRLMDESRPVLAALSPVALATCDADRAEVLLAAGMTGEATELLGSVARTYGSRGLRQAQGEAELVLARALVLEDAPGAAVVARRAARRFRARGAEGWALRADAVAIMAEVQAGGGSGALTERADAVAERLAASHFQSDATALRLQAARLRIRGGRLDDARRIIAEVRVTAGTRVTTRLLAREVGAELAVADGRPRRALAIARAGLDELGEWQSTFGSLDLQSSLVGHGRRLVLDALRIAMANGRPTEAFEWSERTRSLSSRIVPLRPPSDQRIADDLTELRQLRALDPAPQSADGRREAALRQAVRRRQWADRGSGSVAAVAEIDDVQRQLDSSGAVLLSYLWAGESLSALVVTPEEATLTDLGAWAPIRGILDGLLADLDMAAASLPPALERAVRASLRERLDRLAAAIVLPVLPRLGAGRIVLTPPGVLSGVPWSMLPPFAGRPITLPTSATRWLEQRQSALTLASAGFSAGPGVERAVEEVTAAAASWGSSSVLLGSEASSEGVASLAAHVDLLHVSAHGRHSADNPLFSGIELADGPWFGYDIGQLPRVPSAVVLSACELGRSAVRWGLEALGMSQAWLHAGARCVIASPAIVGDSAACDLLSAAHDLLATGAAPADALAAASGSVGFSSSFQCYGAGW
jgi:tetratricopeptide (TPR) repeat protein